MIFTSPEFVIFFVLVVPAYFLLPHRWRWVLLLVASYFFYGYGSLVYVPVLILTTLIDYTAALIIDRSDQPRTRRLWLAASIGANLGILFLFKYFDFFSASVGAALNIAGLPATPPQLSLVLPVGISFYTFQSMAYTIDVYRRAMKPEANAGRFATFVVFFPQLVAGPIERAPHLLPQFRLPFTFDEARAVEGLRLMLWGFFKKVVIADRLAIYVNTVYNNVDGYSGQTLIIATIFFAFQIYCDFSAYSDIAIGAAKIMGFDLMQNFREPYFAGSVREFWSRWHISLSTWFRDYLYIPLGGNRLSLGRTLLNLMIVFVVSGLWHGASWTFVIWGALHGLASVIETYGRTRGIRIGGRDRVWVLVRTGLTFAFICFTWIFFRANSLDDAAYVVSNLFTFNAADVTAPFAAGLLDAGTEFALAWALIALLLLVDWAVGKWGFARLFNGSPAAARWAVYYALGAAVIFSGLYGSGAQEFIYFQF